MDVGFLRALYETSPDRSGHGYVSLYLDNTMPSTGKVAVEAALRWRSARERLAADGADDATLAAVQQAVTGDTPAGGGHVVFASAGRVRLSSTMPQPPPSEVVSYTPLPHVVPWLAQRPARLPHLRIAATRTGGQVVAVSEEAVAAEKVAGESWPVHKPHAGGWSMARFQRSAEETWDETAKKIVDAATAEATRINARFVIVGGDIRERTIVLERLPTALREVALIVDREVEPDAPQFAEAADAEAARQAGVDSQARLGEFRARMNVADPTERRATEGVHDTLIALRDGLVSDVLLAVGPLSAATAWVGPGMTDAATEMDELLERGVSRPAEDRADAALVRAAVGTDAELHFLPDDADLPAGGVAALLRAPAASL
jgi:Bacterial archaeo-eukaryotic release factor family 2